jgi:membrane protein implicated in regulation of membrane protease activity
MMGGSLGLAILASLAAARTGSLTAAGADAATALNSGYHLAFLLGAIAAFIAFLLGWIFVRTRTPAHDHAQQDEASRISLNGN